MSMLVAAQVTAIATAVLAVFALATAVTASLALWKQSQEVRLLKQDQEREVAERRKAQASAVFMWEERPFLTGGRMHQAPARPLEGGSILVRAKVKNAGDRPVYDLYFIWRVSSRIWYTDLKAKMLMPGEEAGAEREPPEGLDDPGRFGVDVVFRDTAGVRWRRKSDGYLEEVTAEEARLLLPEEARSKLEEGA